MIDIEADELMKKYNKLPNSSNESENSLSEIEVIHEDGDSPDCLNFHEQDLLWDSCDYFEEIEAHYASDDTLEKSDVVKHFMARTGCTKKQAIAVVIEHIDDCNDYMAPWPD